MERDDSCNQFAFGLHQVKYILLLCTNVIYDIIYVLKRSQVL